MSHRIPAAAALAAALALSPPAGAADPVTIAVVLSETPAPAAFPAALIRAGIEAAVQAANAEEAGKAHPVQVVFADDRGTLPGAGEAAGRLLADGRAVALIGGQVSATAPAQIAAAARAERPFVNVNGWDAGLRVPGVAAVFHIAPDARTVPAMLARSAAALAATRVALTAPVTDRGAEARAEPLKVALAALEPPVPAAFVPFDPAQRGPAAAAPLRRDPPDLVFAVQGGAAGARFLGQLRQAGIAPTARTLVLDAAGIADSAAFWEDARESGRLLLSVALHHPAIPVTARGEAVRRALPTDLPETRLFHQGADAVFLLVDGLRRARSTDATALVRAMDAAPATGTRGPIRFQTDGGTRQRIDIPFALVQHQEQGAPAERAQAIWVPGRSLRADRLLRPGASAATPARPEPARPVPPPAKPVPAAGVPR
ncbi:ABC transporter substrate-binding protein [Stella sp.]|uniref:ABC transporter substrate-binding protein n=1 Tax=Stella sp. TaxID=2912054 RepID=UPI0035B2032C